MTALPLPREFFAGDARDVARALVGKLLVRSDGRIARLVEVEAYMGLDDPASHAFRGRPHGRRSCSGPPASSMCTSRTASTGAPTSFAGRTERRPPCYCGRRGPSKGVPAMRAARWHGQRELRERDLCRGPGRLCEAFGITGAQNGLDLTTQGGLVCLADDGAGSDGPVVATLRVGLTRGTTSPWRFIVKGSPWVSGPREAGQVPASVEGG